VGPRLSEHNFTHLESPNAIMFPDPRIEEEVRATLRRDPRIKHPELIAVSVDEIGTVVLGGAVGTLPERLAAAHDARHVEGVFNVIVDDLRLRPPVGPRRSDD
jgi:osmotically-inducible protein OsmY